jgi:hypothetical protein
MDLAIPIHADSASSTTQETQSMIRKMYTLSRSKASYETHWWIYCRLCPKSINLGAVPREGFNGTKIAPTRRNMAHHLCQKSLYRRGNEKELLSRQFLRDFLLKITVWYVIGDPCCTALPFPLLFLLAWEWLCLRVSEIVRNGNGLFQQQSC